MPTKHTTTVANLRRLADDLETPISIWIDRSEDPTHPRPWERQSINDSVHTIDLMLADLHRLRANLVVDARRWDDAAIAAFNARHGVA
ncbi:hypothetical protein HQ32_04471 [Prauserella sp. Am3]|nr:hypothetical protein HQ32_04471 [Prauserella sp. Am3]